MWKILFLFKLLRSFWTGHQFGKTDDNHVISDNLYSCFMWQIKLKAYKHLVFREEVGIQLDDLFKRILTNHLYLA